MGEIIICNDDITANINEFMRSQSMATRLMTLVVRSEPGVRYLWYVMQPTMKSVLAKQQNYLKVMHH